MYSEANPGGNEPTEKEDKMKVTIMEGESSVNNGRNLTTEAQHNSAC